ncbi:MAG TPA: acyloxyacyl hydrolase [Burkholderiaceae bacterium]|nr:acyloxyacyl hydrolase [Burkholderiaceae bacterium]
MQRGDAMQKAVAASREPSFPRLRKAHTGRIISSKTSTAYRRVAVQPPGGGTNGLISESMPLRATVGCSKSRVNEDFLPEADVRELGDRRDRDARPFPSSRDPLRLLTGPIRVLFSLVLAFLPAAAHAEAVAVEVGYGQDVRVQSIDLDFDWCRTCELAAPEHTSLALEFAVEAMQGHRSQEANNNLFAFGAMPLLRYAWPNREGALFVEDGVGVRLVSRTRLYNERVLSTAFQFGELLGVGMRFCRHNVCEVGLRVQHMSNGNIKRPNDGVTFTAIRVALHWK